MRTKIKTMQWFLLITGIIILVIGVGMLFTPLDNLVFVALYIGLSMLISGVSEIATFFSEEKGARSGWILTSGILSLLFGIWTFFGRGVVALTVALPFVFAMWIMATGITRIVGSLAHKAAGSDAWIWILLLGILGTFTGFLLMFSPMVSAVIVSYMIAAMIIIHGVNNILIFFSMKKLGSQIRKNLGKR